MYFVLNVCVFFFLFFHPLAINLSLFFYLFVNLLCDFYFIQFVGVSRFFISPCGRDITSALSAHHWLNIIDTTKHHCLYRTRISMNFDIVKQNEWEWGMRMRFNKNHFIIFDYDRHLSIFFVNHRVVLWFPFFDQAIIIKEFNVILLWARVFLSAVRGNIGPIINSRRTKSSWAESFSGLSRI